MFHLIRRPLFALVLGIAAALTLGACESKSEDKKEAEKPGEEKAADKAGEEKAEEKADEGALPTTLMTLALDQGTVESSGEASAIPATIEVPEGCTTFNDSPTAIRVNYGEGRERGKVFGLQIKEGNEFNTNLAETATGLLENKYGNTNAIVEQTETLLVYTMTNDESGTTSHKFTMLLDLAGKTWVCSEGNYGGYTKEQIDRQLEACKTLKAK